jgi:hypothetical protein
VQVKAVAWFGLTAKITSWQVWKATEQLHWLKRNLQLELEFPDSTKIKVTGALTWFLAKLKAFELFGEWRKHSRLTREGTRARGITADVVIQIVRGVAEGSNPIPLEYGLK